MRNIRLLKAKLQIIASTNVFHGNVRIANQELQTVRDVDTQSLQELLKHVDVLLNIGMMARIPSVRLAQFSVQPVPI
jgi:hypothetical protein